MNRGRILGLTLVALAVAVLLYVGTPPPPSQSAVDALQFRFTWVYIEVLIDEVLLLLLVAALLIPLVNRHSKSVLGRKVWLSRPARALAMLALVAGFLLFAFWATVDLLGGYGGPRQTFSTYPSVLAIYNGIGLNHLIFWDQQGVIGFLSFSVSVLGFMALRARRSIGTAVKEGITLFVSPVLVVFELALWYCAPLDMYWHVTTFASLSVGRYLTAEEFTVMMNSGYIFVWAGNVYLLSNWFVLLAAFILFVLGISTRRRPSLKPFHRKL